MKKILIVVFILFILIAANFQVIRNVAVAPQDTFYTGAMGFFFDYYQFLSWMRDGENGTLLLSSRYIPARESGVLLHPLFPLLGGIGKLVQLPSYLMYHLARNVFLLAWIGSMASLCIVFSKKKRERIALFFLILFASSFPSITLSPIIPFWQTFYTLEKFIIPPHHLLANTLFLIIIVFLASKLSFARKLNFFEGLFLSLCSIILFLVNPGSATFLLFLFIIVFAVWWSDSRNLTPSIPGILLFSVLPFALYNFVIFQTKIPWKYYYEGEAVGRYMVTFFEYLLSLGPLFFIALFSFFYLRKFRLLEKISAIWLILPPLLFPFVGRQIPFSMSRLFALNLFIPASLLTVFFLQNFKPQDRWNRLGKRILIFLLSLSLALGFSYSLKNVFSYQLPFYYNIFLPKDLLTSIEFIQNNTNSSHTILAGQNISSLLPAFTDARVVLGRLDAYPDYEKVKSEADDIYFRRIADNQILIRLKTWHVKYILFGLDHIGYDTFLGKGEIEGIEEVWRSGNIVIAEVRY